MNDEFLLILPPVPPSGAGGAVVTCLEHCHGQDGLVVTLGPGTGLRRVRSRYVSKAAAGAMSLPWATLEALCCQVLIRGDIHKGKTFGRDGQETAIGPQTKD